MTKLQEIIQQLPEVQRKQVEEYASDLLAVQRRRDSSAEDKPNRIRLEELEGLLVKVSDDMSDAEIEKRILNDWADAAEG